MSGLTRPWAARRDRTLSRASPTRHQSPRQHSRPSHQKPRHLANHSPGTLNLPHSAPPPSLSARASFLSARAPLITRHFNPPGSPTMASPASAPGVCCRAVAAPGRMLTGLLRFADDFVEKMSALPIAEDPLAPLSHVDSPPRKQKPDTRSLQNPRPETRNPKP